MTYVALYRKWRPQEFDELIGQPHITRTLKNALKAERISHAYLFCGPRGTGKTSAAKILSKALNCQEGPSPRPCNQCPICQGINGGRVMDVLEIDAASNRGIDEIRELRSKVRYGSTEGRFKIYIIDEVHMLTPEAFNALLKTLEEPPQGVVFILATTEPHKLPATILSRCQRFDFHRIGIPALIEGLSRVASREGAEVEEEALKLIARSSEGGMRDALGLLEQVLSFSDGSVDLEGARQVLGIEEEELFIRLGEAVLKNDLLAALKIIQEVVDRGRDMSQFLRDMTNYFRGLILLKIQGEETLDIPWSSLTTMGEQARSFSQEGLLEVNEILTEGVYQLRGSSQPRFVLETSVFQICHLDHRLSAKDLQRRIEELERNLSSPASYPVSSPGGKENPRQGQPSGEGKLKEEDFPPDPEINVSEGGREPGEENISLGKIQKDWEDILNSLARTRVVTCSWLESSKPLSLENNFLVVQVKNSVAQGILEKEEHYNNVKEAIKSFTGKEVHLKFILGEREVIKEEGDSSYPNYNKGLPEEGPRDFDPLESRENSGEVKKMADFLSKGEGQGEKGLWEEALELFEGKIYEGNIMEEDEFKKGGFFNEGQYGKDDETGAKNAGGHG